MKDAAVKLLNPDVPKDKKVVAFLKNSIFPRFKSILNQKSPEPYDLAEYRLGNNRKRPFPFSKISMDSMGPIDTSQSNDTALREQDDAKIRDILHEIQSWEA